MMRNLLAISALVLLTGCVSSSEIQSKYNQQADICRDQAAQLAARNASNPAIPDTGAGVYFGECMNKTGWRVSVPKPTQTATGPVVAPPSGAPSTNPSASTGLAPVTAAPRAVAPATPMPVAAAPVYPPSGAPSTIPSAAAARYQPARPASAASAPSYGTGAGRQF